MDILSQPETLFLIFIMVITAIPAGFAAGLFGIITAAGLVYPCEILEDKLLGDLRENNMRLLL